MKIIFNGNKNGIVIQFPPLPTVKLFISIYTTPPENINWKIIDLAHYRDKCNSNAKMNLTATQ